MAIEAHELAPTLSGADYCSAGVFDTERHTIFHAGWWYVGHISSLPLGGRAVVDIAGESVIVTRDPHGTIRAFANVCRHRGARLCEQISGTALPTLGGARSIQCPYHAWTYGLDGRLLATPRVGRDEVDRATHGLWSHRADTWNGLVFVSLREDGPELSEWLDRYSPELSQFTELPIADLTVHRLTASVIAANWKVIIENYLECLHCPVVHPELVEVVPLYRSGRVIDPDRTDGAASLVAQGNSFTESGTSDLPSLPGIGPEDENLYRGAVAFPNLLVDVTPTALVLTALYPVAPDRTVTVSEYLFAPEATDAIDDLDDVIAFMERVGRQDADVCERVQQGVSSTFFTTGALTEKDSLITTFNDNYLEARGPIAAP